MKKVYRAEVIGSLLRPQYLIDAREALKAGRLGPADLKRLEDRAVDEALALQERAGVDVVTDGEMRRSIFTDPLSAVLDGLARVGSVTLHWRTRHGNVSRQQDSHPPLFAVVDKIRRRQWLARDEFDYARKKSKKPLKVTLPDPMMGALLWSPQHSLVAYPDPVRLMADMTDILREEIHELAAIGCEYVQIDAPELTWLADEARLRELSAVHPKMPDWMRNEGIDALNAVAVEPNVTFGLHMCRGNFQGYWLSEAPWEALSKQIFRRTPNFDLLLLEYDDWRSGSFEPLRELPRDKLAVLGLLSTKREALEPVEEITARIEEAARCFPREQLALSTQCGFAPEPHGNVLSVAAQEAKLRRVAEIAHAVWG